MPIGDGLIAGKQRSRLGSADVAAWFVMWRIVLPSSGKDDEARREAACRLRIVRVLNYTMAAD